MARTSLDLVGGVTLKEDIPPIALVVASTITRARGEGPQFGENQQGAQLTLRQATTVLEQRRMVVRLQWDEKWLRRQPRVEATDPLERSEGWGEDEHRV